MTTPTGGGDRLAAALAAEHAAIYGYGVAGAWLDGGALDAARAAEAAHRTRRDTLLGLLAGASAAQPPAQPAYALPFPVTDGPSALRLAVHLEERTAAVWRHALAATEPGAPSGSAGPSERSPGARRQLALDALVDCAVRATRWRVAAGVTPSTVALPGT